MEDDVEAALAEFLGESQAYAIGGAGDESPGGFGGVEVAGEGRGAGVGVGMEGKAGEGVKCC